MPIRLKPGGILAVTLDFERDLPEADRLTWQCRALTVAEKMDYEAAADAAMKLPEGAKQFAAIRECIKRIAVDWNLVDESGNPLPFDDANLNEFTAAALYRFMWELPRATTMGILEKKWLPLPSA